MKLIIFLFVFGLQYSFAQLPADKKLKVDSLIQQYIETKQFSGCVLVAKNNEVLYQQAFGYANREEQVPNRIATNFNIASMGKTFTATLIMQLVQEGKLSIDQTLASILPEYNVKKADSITVWHLLTHTSGVGNYMMHVNFEAERHQLKSLNDVMPYVVAMDPTLDYVGQRHDYSNSGFILLGKIIEKITGKSYMQNLEERIFKPAGIKRSYIHYPATFVAPNEATPYLAYTGKTFINAAAEEFPAFSDGGMQSNVIDLYRFAKALLNGKLLSATMRDSMWSGKVATGRADKYSFGWVDEQTDFGKRTYSHSGGGKGFSSDLKIVKEDGYIVIVLINNRVNPREVTNNILRILYSKDTRKPEKYLENVLMEVTEQKGFDYVRTNYKSILKEKGFDKTPNPWVYIMFSDMFEMMKDFDKAFEVIEMGREEFPKEASLYNVTGQLYANQKKFKEAAEWFNKALAINPEDEFAKMMLKNISTKL
ncbi:serine hydrolase domain-containing protein [Lacibacter sediminis]|uniref:Serine hydrolase n=1 Tax=Lacibacter sediminis TaxID=2760713 RepID=A0A7G5XD37_9BACT|nr:serine hydrolase domain-containing protein [Lacibacter sediminis]QNA43390.1 serine hydrolase [Lacibacter sediminis]